MLDPDALYARRLVVAVHLGMDSVITFFVDRFRITGLRTVCLSSPDLSNIISRKRVDVVFEGSQLVGTARQLTSSLAE